MSNEASVAVSEEFAGRLGNMVNGGALALMLAVGHRVGLFDAMAGMPPSTSAQIAQAAGLDERYVREWLAAVTVGGIIDHDPREMTFRLPPERAVWLTRAAGPDNLAMHAQWVTILAGVEDQIVGLLPARRRSSLFSIPPASAPSRRAYGSGTRCRAHPDHPAAGTRPH